MFYAASSLQPALYQEQIGYLQMCLDANLGNHISVTSQGDTPVMIYDDEDNDEDTCLDNIDSKFIKIYPITIW